MRSSATVPGRCSRPALQAEVAAYIEQHADDVDENGHRLEVRNGYHDERQVATAAGAVRVRQPRVNDRRIDEATGERKRFASAILPAWARKSPQIAEVLPLLYLHGLFSGDFIPALEQFLGASHGLSSATVTRLTEQWRDDAKRFGQRSLTDVDYVYVWVDGIHLKVRLDQDKVCLLVMIGVRADGRKELVALADGHRESSESWADLLRDCKRRGMRAPVLAVGDGALGFWKAIRDIFPETKEQRCWWHKTGNVLAALPKSAHPAAKKALGEVYKRRRPRTRRGRRQGLCRCLRGEVAEGGGEDHRGPRRAARVLRLPRRALDPSAHHQSDRVHLRHRPAAAAGHQGTRLSCRRCRDGVQAPPVRRTPLARRQCTPPGRARPRRGTVRQGHPRRTTRRPRIKM
jgi:putative transposase